MQEAYKQELASAYGITFNSLMCLNNMPIKRFADFLLRNGQLSEYMQVDSVLCCADTTLPSSILHASISSESRRSGPLAA